MWDKDMACRKGGLWLAHSGHGVSKEGRHTKSAGYSECGRAGGWEQAEAFRAVKDFVYKKSRYRG